MQTNLKDFSGETLYIGIDVHLKSWNVTILSQDMELRNFTQEPDGQKLSWFLKKYYPGASYKCVYEAGFAGFNTQRELSAQGLDCMLIHPADVPTSDKDRRHKSDKIDSRKLAKGLRNKDFKPLHIPDMEQQQDRSLMRVHDKITRDITRVKNRIKSFLMFFGFNIPKEFEAKKWSKAFLNWLETIHPGGLGDISFKILLNEFHSLNAQRRLLGIQIKELSSQPRYKQKAALLMSIPGIGLQTAMILLTEIGDINRFPGVKELSAYFGLIPDCHDSGETKIVRGNTKRGNVYLKYILIEVSWMCIRYDSSLLLTYRSASRTMDKNKAIIRVARKLLNRVRFVLKNEKPYQVFEA